MRKLEEAQRAQGALEFLFKQTTERKRRLAVVLWCDVIAVNDKEGSTSHLACLPCACRAVAVLVLSPHSPPARTFSNLERGTCWRRGGRGGGAGFLEQPLTKPHSITKVAVAGGRLT